MRVSRRSSSVSDNVSRCSSTLNSPGRVGSSLIKFTACPSMFSPDRRDGVRADPSLDHRGELDRVNPLELWQCHERWQRTRSWPAHGCERQSLRHDRIRRDLRLRLRDGIEISNVSFPTATPTPSDLAYAIKSAAVSVPLGAPINVLSVTQSGTTITVNGTGFSTLTVINFFATTAAGVENLGGLTAGGAAKIPLTLINSTRFTFNVPDGRTRGSGVCGGVQPALRSLHQQRQRSSAPRLR